MRILLLAFDLGLQGGVGTFNYELVEALAEKNLEVLTVVKYDINFVNKYPNLNIKKFHSLKIPPKDVIFYISNMYEITRVVDRFKPDVIHDSSGGLQFLPWLSRYAPVVVTVHGSPLLNDLRILYGSFRDWIRFRLYQYSHYTPAKLLSLLNKAKIERAVFVSKTCLADTLAHLDPKSREILRRMSTVIYNGVSIKRVKDVVKDLDEEYDEHSIAFAGRLMEYKGVDRLIKAFSHVVKELHKAKLYIIGSGPEMIRLKELSRKLGLENNVVFYGWMPRNKVLKIISSSDLLAHPSLYESFGYVIVEAYALGKPVIAHKAPYSKELVERIEAGATVDTFNEKTFSEALLTLLTDENLYKKYSINAQKAAEEIFDINVSADKYIKVYESLINSN
jgi:glycosyltransferase involved in cell wall biosynthesis